ncbi:PREDICTED: dual specificity protein phosphatase 16 [Poecilia mexicana]|uniref:Protein-serine/threonine phosphatase n=1 Tax=Poecilia mexicana TaxID=48701 RepID=A0A3B3YAT8_9TELE|nr:PREDICTED: dual specificity protein phosphatase 16 [Poecilia mexicana]
MPRPSTVRPIGPEALVVLLEGGLDRVVLIDSRPFVDYNTSHILEALNVNGSKLMKRRLQQDKVQITELLQHCARSQLELQGDQEVVVYDQNSSDPAALGADSFLSVLLVKLERSFPSVHLLSGGFCEFSQLFPGLCEGKSVLVPSCPSQSSPAISSLGPTRILPHLYLGCQRDVLNKELMEQNDIAFVLNASNTCPKPDFVPESHFLRVPVNDSFCEKILPWLDRSLDFIEKAKASDGRVLVHCLAGISRSATIAIAYIMKRMDMSLDEAYRFVKEKRPTISPNFNFLGQLLDFEKNIKSPDGSESQPDPPGAGLLAGQQGAEPPSEPQPPPCDPADQLAEALGGAQLADGSEDSARLKRSFSLDIKAFGEPGASPAHRAFGPHTGPGTSPAHRAFGPHGSPGDDFYKAAPSSKACQFSPVEEVSEQSTPEPSPDQEEASRPDRASGPDREASPGSCPAPTDQLGSSPAPKSPAGPQHLQRSGSMEESSTSFLLGLSHSQQQLARPGSGSGSGSALKGWHSDILLGPMAVSASSLTAGWYLSSETTRFYSSGSVLSGAGFGPLGCGAGLEAVRRRQRAGDRGNSRRSWHEESSFEKQLKRRSCQLDGSREDMRPVPTRPGFSGSMEVIQVS